MTVTMVAKSGLLISGKGDMVIGAANTCQATAFGEVMLPATCSRVAIITKGRPPIIKRCNLGFANADGRIKPKVSRDHMLGM